MIIVSRESSPIYIYRTNLQFYDSDFIVLISAKLVENTETKELHNFHKSSLEKYESLLSSLCDSNILQTHDH